MCDRLPGRDVKAGAETFIIILGVPRVMMNELVHPRGHQSDHRAIFYDRSAVGRGNHGEGIPNSERNVPIRVISAIRSSFNLAK